MTKNLIRLLGVALLGAVATASFAGGPIFTYDPENRIPYAWQPMNWPGGAVPVYHDLGNLGRLSATQANTWTISAWDQWNNVYSSAFTAEVVGDFSLIGLGDVTDANVAQIIGTFNGGGIHVIYDNDGNIMRNFFGVSPTGVLGISNLDFAEPDGPEILEAWTVLSGPGVRSNDPSGFGFSGVFTHEFGHTLNLAHSTTNGQTGSPNNDQPQARDCAAPWTGKPGIDTYETMYPSINPTPSGSGVAMFTVDRLDDIAAISNLYPANGWPDAEWGTIRGTIKARRRAQGGTENNEYEVTGVNVIARRVDSPFDVAGSYLSGQVSKGFAGPDGSYEINGLVPGADYVVYVDNLLSGAYSVPRMLSLPGPEEYYNGADESGDGLTDDRCAWTTIHVEAGAPVTADIVFNRVKGAPEFIPSPGVGIPTDITPDGVIVVGQLGSSSVFRWGVEDGSYQNIGGIPSGQPAISDDGTRIAANDRDENGVLAYAIYENGVWTTLPPRPDATVPCGSGANASWGGVYDISGDGSTVVGLSYSNGCSQSNGSIRGFKWTAAGGTQALPKYDAPGRAGRANAVNYDGSFIVGWDDSAAGSRRGAYWSGATVDLIQPDPTMPSAGESLDVTGDGGYIVGLSHGGFAWRFSAFGGLEDLGTLSGARSSGAGAVSADGRVVGGWSDFFFSRVPTIWTSELGWSDLNQFMNAQGTYATDIVIANSTAMSADGRTMTGWADSIFGRVGWVLKMPKAVMCHASPGNPKGQTHTIDVAFPGGLGDHLAHGDTLGICQHGGM